MHSRFQNNQFIPIVKHFVHEWLLETFVVQRHSNGRCDVAPAELLFILLQKWF